MELILIRHGETEGNRERRFIGVTDEPLSPAGVWQAEAAVERLPAAEHVYCSPLQRCGETASLIWPNVPQTVIPQLRETDFGPFEGRNHRELQDDPLYRRWLAGETPAGVETAEDAADRALEGFGCLLEDAARQGFARVAVVSHGGTLMAILGALGRPERDFYGWKCPNCGGVRAVLHTEPLFLEIVETV